MIHLYRIGLMCITPVLLFSCKKDCSSGIILESEYDLEHNLVGAEFYFTYDGSMIHNIGTAANAFEVANYSLILINDGLYPAGQYFFDHVTFNAGGTGVITDFNTDPDTEYATSYIQNEEHVKVKFEMDSIDYILTDCGNSITSCHFAVWHRVNPSYPRYVFHSIVPCAGRSEDEMAEYLFSTEFAAGDTISIQPLFSSNKEQ